MNVTLLSAVEQLALLEERRISPLELAEEHIRQIERLNPQLNALIEFDPEQVRSQAREAKSGPLAGLPITVKSSIEVKDYRCEIGSALNRGQIAHEDAESVARLRRAGTTVLGTTNCPEFLMAYETDNLLYGKTCNPWNLEYSAGGSSGGEASAIAAGLSAGGLGSDSGGSVREPAHFCGIASLKPTPGRVPGRGHRPSSVGPFSILGAVGPMARTIADVALLFRTLCAQDSLDPESPPVEPARGFTGPSEADSHWMVRGRRSDARHRGNAAGRCATQRSALERQGFTCSAFVQRLLKRRGSYGGFSSYSAEPCFISRRSKGAKTS